jgi:hypothetical protein
MYNYQRQLPPTHCIICGTKIDQPQWGGRVRRYCDKPGCRKKGSRINKAAERQRWEKTTTERLRQYWQGLLPDSQRQLDELLQSRWITTESKEGAYYHRNVDIADSVTRIIEAERRQAWRMVERYTVVLEQRAEKAEAHEAALQEELKALRQLLPGALHKEIEQQPKYTRIIDAAPNVGPGRPLAIAGPGGDQDDAARTYAILAQAGIKPVAQALAEQQQEDEDDTESYDEEDGEGYNDEED